MLRFVNLSNTYEDFDTYYGNRNRALTNANVQKWLIAIRHWIFMEMA